MSNKFIIYYFILGGNMDERYKPVTTKPYFLTVGQDPFLQYNEKATRFTVYLGLEVSLSISSG